MDYGRVKVNRSYIGFKLRSKYRNEDYNRTLN